ncbi:MAG: ABC transporter ATP-binding protein [Myxococcales bacterium]|nr:ABC transporter ATP-binding protein [Myxococcales bacterium]
MDSESPLLSVSNLSVTFASDYGNVVAVAGLTFEVFPGEALGIVGESGSGKSVTNLAITGLLPCPPGQIKADRMFFDEKDLLRLENRDLRAIRGRDIAMVFQDPMTSLNPFLRVERQLTEVLEQHLNMSRKDALNEAIAMLERIRIPDAAKRIRAYPHELSGGMRQRVMIAMALLCKPKLLIADEPTTALDVTIQAQILDLMQQLRQQTGSALILVTHDLGVVAGVADRVLVLYAGCMMETGAARDLLTRPGHPYTLALLRCIPRLDRPKSDTLLTIEGTPPDPNHRPTGCVFHPRCPQAADVCRKIPPPGIQVEKGHISYCHFANETHQGLFGGSA